MDKYAVVDNLLLRGSCPTGPELKVLRDICDVKRILSLDEELGRQISPLCKALGLSQIILPLTDGNGPNIDRLRNEIIPLLLQGPKTYAHCRHGKDRTGMAAAMYRIARGWPLERSLKEAHNFGMGQDMRPSRSRSYYLAIIGSNADNNEAADIVQQQREEMSYNPGINDQTVPNFGQSSFAPFLDVDQERMNRPANDRVISITKKAIKDRISALQALAQNQNNKVLDNKNKERIYIKANNVLAPKQFWYTISNLSGDGKLYSAEIDSSANIHVVYATPTKQALQNALLNEYDVVIFNWKYYYIINPNALIHIQEEEDVNDVPLVGQIDNYTGQAQNVFPGSSGYGYDGGVTGPAGFGHAGFAGIIFGPNNGTQM